MHFNSGTKESVPGKGVIGESDIPVTKVGSQPFVGWTQPELIEGLGVIHPFITEPEGKRDIKSIGAYGGIGCKHQRKWSGTVFNARSMITDHIGRNVPVYGERILFAEVVQLLRADKGIEGSQKYSGKNDRNVQMFHSGGLEQKRLNKLKAANSLGCMQVY